MTIMQIAFDAFLNAKFHAEMINICCSELISAV